MTRSRHKPFVAMPLDESYLSTVLAFAEAFQPLLLTVAALAMEDEPWNRKSGVQLISQLLKKRKWRRRLRKSRSRRRSKRGWKLCCWRRR